MNETGNNDTVSKDTDMNGTDMNDTVTTKPWPLYIIIGMVAFVFITGYLFSPKTESDKLAWIERLGTTNHGTLLSAPVEVSPGQLADIEGNPWTGLDDNTWKLLVLNPGTCEQQCLDRLTELHAMRIRLNRDASRLTVGLLSDRVQNLSTEVLSFADIKQLLLTDSALLSELEQTNMPGLEQGPAVLLMNPIDIFMMAYGPADSAVEMLEDFEHLLKLAH